MRNRVALISIAAITAAGWIGCGEEKPPSRDQIPALKAAVYSLQVQVKEQDRAGIDSLLSAKILDQKQNSDSLLNFVYGPSGDFAFEQFGACDIVYTDESAEADCFVMDSTHQKDRPIRLFFTKTDTLWLLSSFAPGAPDTTE